MRYRTTRKVPRRGAVGIAPYDQTRRVSSHTVSRPDFGGILTLGNLAPGSLLLDDYVVRSTLHPHETASPGLFRCQSRDGRDVLLKVAPTQHPPKPDLWVSLPQLNHPNVVRTFNVIERDGLFYEIQEFCLGGSLADCMGDARVDADYITDYVVPQINEGLKYLHAKDIVHRDIKPANIYLRENDLYGPIVLGDFDISSVLVSDRTSRQTSRMAGTWAYSAPEGFPRFAGDSDHSLSARITRTSDYYSLGISIIELMTGTTSLHSCGLPDLYDFYLTGGRVELPDAPPRLLLLLKGLLVRNRHERWSGPQVDRWIKGSNVRDDMQAIINDQRFSIAKATKPFALGDVQAVDLTGLALAMGRFPEEAKSHLLESDLLTQWIDNQDTAIAHKVERTREKYRHTPDLALYRCIMLCDPNTAFEIPEYGVISTVSDWAPLLANKAPTEKHLQSGPVSDYELSGLEAWLELKTQPAVGTAARVAEIRQRPVATRFEEAAFLFDRRLKYSGLRSAFLNLRLEDDDRLGGDTPNQVVEEAFGKTEDWDHSVPANFRAARDRWQQGYLEAWLRQRGMAELATKAATASNQFRANIDEAFDVFLRHLDPWTEKPQIVFDEQVVAEEFTIEYGAKATLTLSYKTVGPGFPMGSVKLDGAPAQATLDTYRILGRSGKILLGFHPRGKLIEGVKQGAFRLVTDRGNYWMQDDGVEIRYHIVFALKETLLRAVVGATLGATLLGGARFSAYLWLHRAVTADGLFGVTRGQLLDPIAYIVGAVVCLAAIYGAIRLWLATYSRSGL